MDFSPNCMHRNLELLFLDNNFMLCVSVNRRPSIFYHNLLIEYTNVLDNIDVLIFNPVIINYNLHIEHNDQSGMIKIK